MYFKLLLILGCLVIQGFAKPVESEESEDQSVEESEEQSVEESEEEPNEVVKGVASVLEVMDQLIAKGDDIKPSEIRDLVNQLLPKVAEFDSVVDTLILQISNGTQTGEKLPDIFEGRPEDPPYVPRENPDENLAKVLLAFPVLKGHLVTIAEEFEAVDGDASQAIKQLKSLRNILWIARQAGRAALKYIAIAEKNAEEALEEALEVVLEEALLDPKRNLDITNKLKTILK